MILPVSLRWQRVWKICRSGDSAAITVMNFECGRPQKRRRNFTPITLPPPLSISPHKNAQWINEIGEHLAEEYGVRHLPSDFKKKAGICVPSPCRKNIISTGRITVDACSPKQPPNDRNCMNNRSHKSNVILAKRFCFIIETQFPIKKKCRLSPTFQISVLLFSQVFFINLFPHFGQVISILPFPLGTRIFWEQAGHLKKRKICACSRSSLFRSKYSNSGRMSFRKRSFSPSSFLMIMRKKAEQAEQKRKQSDRIQALHALHRDHRCQKIDQNAQ